MDKRKARLLKKKRAKVERRHEAEKRQARHKLQGWVYHKLVSLTPHAAMFKNALDDAAKEEREQEEAEIYKKEVRKGWAVEARVRVRMGCDYKRKR